MQRAYAPRGWRCNRHPQPLLIFVTPMKLLTEEIKKSIPPLYAVENETDPMVWVKFFTPWSFWTWYVLEFDGQDTFFGWVEGFEKELGYFSLAELESAEGPFGLKVERDLYFQPVKLSEVKQDHQAVTPQVDGVDVCMYSSDGAPATKYCYRCGGPLCSFCGARDAAGNVYCNECFAIIERADTSPPKQ